jgi:tRNA threonylcarbamoyl adenosine modification protein YeaZ
MHVLGIETSNPSAWRDGDALRPGVALARAHDGALIDREDLDLGDPLRDDLMPAIARLGARAGATPRSIARVAVSIGPGGFTAVRVATAAAGAIAEATGATLVGVPTADVVARRVAGAGPFAVLLAGKDQTAWAQVYASANEARGEARVVDAAGARRLGVARWIADHHLPTALREVALSDGVVMERPVFDALACVEAAMEREGVDPAALTPIYPREPEAVTKWRALKADRPS